MTQKPEKEDLLKTIEIFVKFHNLLYGGIRVKSFQKLILLDSHLRNRYSDVFSALKVRKGQPNVFKNYASYLSLAQNDREELDYAAEFLGISQRTARDYLKTLDRLNNPIAYLY